MKRGLVIGKFMPVHNGHIALIHFAAAQCEEVIVSMSYTLNDPIDHTIRFGWLIEIFQNHPSVKPELSLDDFDSEELEIVERTKHWADFIARRFPKVDILFSSEEYGASFAEHLAIPHVEFDRQRTSFPVSASLIRAKPFKYWEYIPKVVRPWFVRKICLYGPESTGKSSLAGYFAEKYETDVVPEVAREQLNSNNFTVEDIIQIGIAQTERVQQKITSANKFLFCDTDLITTQIYSRHYLNEVPDILFGLEAAIKYDVYFLMDIDIAWVADGLRDLGDRRQDMFNVFRFELERRKIVYTLVSGGWNDRVKTIENVLRQFS